MGYLGKRSDRDERGRPFRVVVVELMWAEWLPTERLRPNGQRLAPRQLGASPFDPVRPLHAATRVYASVEFEYEDWSYAQILLAGYGDWKIPTPPHPEFIATRPPLEGEVFESTTSLLWASPSELVAIDGEFATQSLKGKHGRRVGDLEGWLARQAYGEALRLLTRRLGHDPRGPVGREIERRLIAECERVRFVEAEGSVVKAIVERVHGGLLNEAE